MPLNAFIVRPFEVKELHTAKRSLAEKLQAITKEPESRRVVVGVEQVGAGELWKVRIDFDAVHRLLLTPVMDELRIKGDTATAVVVAGNIREDMFNRLVTADLVVADLSIHNPNVFYELGVRQAFRDKYTFIIRSDLADYPFDLKTDRYFEYKLEELASDGDAVRRRLAHALRMTLNSTDADSPIFKLLPQLQAEDRARFIAVPEDFREEVEWARHQRRSEHLSLMAVECDGFLWEVEGLRVIGRAQFDSNFIAAAKTTWEQIVSRYPDDVEANSVLSTIYQRMSDDKRSEQALSRVARSRTLSPTRLSELRALNGRNLKSAWNKQWRVGETPKDKQRLALLSPLLQRAFDAFHEAFKTDLNNSYAGLNALTMLVIQTELAQRFPAEWKGIQRRPHEAADALRERRERIRQLIAALELAVESDRERLAQQGVVNPWFNLLEAGVACLVSDQPDYVVQLYEHAVHFAPDTAEDAIRSSLEVYHDLGIGAEEHDKASDIGTVGLNVKRAMEVLSSKRSTPRAATEPQRVLMFLGLRADPLPSVRAVRGAHDAGAATARVFPPEAVEGARRAIEQAIDEEIKQVGGAQRITLGIAAGANGGDLLFHQACVARKISTRMCLALPKPQYVGQFVAPAGSHWVETFGEVHRHLREQAQAAQDAEAAADARPRRARSLVERNAQRGCYIREFSEFSELPRWLQSKPYYNVGRRNNLWMLQHAVAQAQALGENAEITLIVLWKEDSHEGGLGSVRGIGGIGHVKATAEAQGIKIRQVALPPWNQGNGAAAAAMDDEPPPLPKAASASAAKANGARSAGGG